MEGRQLRDRDAIALDLVGVIGLSAFLLGLVMLDTSEKLGFDAVEALNGVLSQLSVTLPGALLILAATSLELATGLVLARAARGRAFDSVSESLLAAMVAAVLKDTLLLGTVAGFGLFRAPVLIGIDVAIIAGALLLAPISRHVRPLTAFASWRDALDSIGSWPVAALVGIVWIGPVVLQLASPVVPFIDVLPNYVGPVEHLRTFGWFSPLSETQSPIIGPSRTVLGYDGLLGALATMTNLPGGLAIAAFIAPQTVLVAAGAYRLASALRDRTDVPIGAWALLAFALSQSFARLADARGTVVVVPLICLGLALAADSLRRMEDPWRIGRGAVIGLALGAATLVHPVIAFFAIVTVGIAGLARPRDLGADAFVATLTAGLIALPQLATMLGASLPTLALGVWLPVAVAIGLAAGRLIARRERLRDGIVRAAEIGRFVAVVVVVGGIAIAFAASILDVERVPKAFDPTLTLVLESSGLLLVVLIAGALAGSTGAPSPLVWAGALVGVVAVLLANVLPDDLGFLGDALRFEVPKSVHYWLSSIAAAGAAAALAYLWATDRLPWLVRAAGLAAFVAIAALPVRPEPIDSRHLGEHRWSETFAIDLKYADSGYWVGFPDSRHIVDEPRRAILDAVRAEIDAGRLQHDTPVLHIAKSFQQWVATPLGVFDGVTETFISLDPEVTHQTVGGRLEGFEAMPSYLAAPVFPYVVLEPDGVPEGTREQLIAAGYASIFANDQGEVFVLPN
ncbi:MAG TPA: hypothetical protein VIF63_03790 [Candidatus Limnocylindrales bacterium]